MKVDDWCGVIWIGGGIVFAIAGCAAVQKPSTQEMGRVSGCPPELMIIGLAVVWPIFITWILVDEFLLWRKKTS